ncbi:MAG: serine protease [Isosphaeraceae bacterium]
MLRISWRLGLTLWFTAIARAEGPDDLTFRPTVLVRQGDAAGTGTVIASIPGETLVLTASHVATAEGGTPIVEVHRYNLGLERSRPAEGWPVRLPAEIVARDPAGDVAVLRIVGKTAMPHVARLARPGEVAHRGAVVTSVGIDGADHLSSWIARVVETSWFVMEPVTSRDDPDLSLGVAGGSGRSDRKGIGADPTGPERPFLLTTRAPVQGRSGGGLFDSNAFLIGVCVGRLEAGPGRGQGVFASGESVRRLLREHDLEASLARSDAYQRREQTGTRSPATVVKPEAEHHNTDRVNAGTSRPSRADRARDGQPAHGRP